MSNFPPGMSILTSRELARQMWAIDRAEAEEEDARVSRSEAFALGCAHNAEMIREEMAAKYAVAMAEARRAELAAQQERAERQAQFEDYRTSLLASGRTWRTPAETLAAYASQPF